MQRRLDGKRIAHSFKWGFLSDRTVEILNKFKKNNSLSDEDKETLKLTRNLFEMILNGEQQASEGKYSMNALESLKIYNRSREIISTDGFINFLSESSDLKEVINIMDKCILSIITDNLCYDNLDTSILFFNLLRKLTLSESQMILESYYENRGYEKWNYLLESIL